jgi:IS1 family transposase
MFYTDNWHAFAEILPPERHVIGKSGTITIEQDNSNTRHHLGRFTRRTKVVSKCLNMIYYTIRIWHAVTVAGLFDGLRNIACAIF